MSSVRPQKTWVPAGVGCRLVGWEWLLIHLLMPMVNLGNAHRSHDSNFSEAQGNFKRCRCVMYKFSCPHALVPPYCQEKKLFMYKFSCSMPKYNEPQSCVCVQTSCSHAPGSHVPMGPKVPPWTLKVCAPMPHLSMRSPWTLKKCMCTSDPNTCFKQRTTALLVS